MSKETKRQKRFTHLPDVSGQISERAAVLSQIVQILRTALSPEESPTVRVKKHRDGFQYYLKENGEEHYIPVAELDTLRPLFQAEYDRKVLASAEKELDILRKYMVFCSESAADRIYPKFQDGKRSLISPIIPTEDEYLAAWENMKYSAKPISESAVKHVTARGEQVRSKSEELIANALYAEGIPYHYEMPLSLDGKTTLYPDFTLLELRSKKIIYWEHLGMMDDREYAREAVRRIRDYAFAGIFPGDKLILTFETMACPMTSAIATNVIRHYMKQEPM